MSAEARRLRKGQTRVAPNSRSIGNVRRTYFHLPEANFPLAGVRLGFSVALFALLFAIRCAGIEPTPDAAALAEFQSHIASLQQAAEQERDVSDCDGRPDRYWAAMCKVGALTAQGEFTEAASVLSADAINLAPEFQRDSLMKKLAILRKWAGGDAVSAEDFRAFYLEDAGYMFSEQVRPILTLYACKQIADRDKYPILAALFERRSDWRGQALALLLIANLAGSDKKAGCSALVGAGNAFYELKEPVRAEKAWTEASHCPQNLSSWPKAVYNLGILESERRNYQKAIGDFQLVLASHPNDKEPGGNLMEIYRNYSHSSALEISYCYEGMGDYNNALKYALLAKNRYPYYSWCGTCLASESLRLKQRITYLSIRRFPLVVALLVMYLFSIVL